VGGVGVVGHGGIMAGGGYGGRFISVGADTYADGTAAPFRERCGVIRAAWAMQYLPIAYPDMKQAWGASESGGFVKKTGLTASESMRSFGYAHQFCRLCWPADMALLMSTFSEASPTNTCRSMISADSVLRNLPSGLDRKQALFFDGIRHAAEIAEFSYRRLQETLATIATENHQTSERAPLFTAAFVDAWAIVDSLDRFRSLWQLLPVPGYSSRREAVESSFLALSQPVRDLRNVADHLAQRADYVVAKNGSALGILSWVTIPNGEALRALSCAIIPGTVQKHRAKIPLPMGKIVELPSDLIELKAGEHSVCLSEQLPRVRAIIEILENSLDKEFRSKGVRDQCANTDVLFIGDLDMYAQAPTK
jgi:hypothetical protein